MPGGPRDAHVSNWDDTANSLHIDADNVFTRQDLASAERLRVFLDESVPVNAVVVGAGFSGLEQAQALSERGLNVTVIEEAAQALPALDAEMSALVEAELVRCGVRVLVGGGPRAYLLAEGGQVEAVETKSGERIATDLVLFTTGVRPEARGTVLWRVFGLEVGATGLGLQAARNAGYDANSASVHAELHVLVVYERASGKLLGAQAVGAKEIDKHIHVLATALHFGAILADLAALDLPYSRQLSGAG